MFLRGDRSSKGKNPMKVRVSVWLATVLAGTMLTGCGDECTVPETTGHVRITLGMSGGNPDTSGCTVTLDGAVTKTIMADESVVFSDVEVGSHLVRLEELSVNCSVNGDNPRVVRIKASQATEVVFDVSCVATPLGRIAFTSNRRSISYDIWVVNADGSNPIDLTPVPGIDNWAAWTRNGMKIAYNSNATGNDEIYVMYHDGSYPARITDSPSYDGCPSWSPDGTKIAFTSSRDGNREIYVMNADGSDQVNLTNDPVWDHNAAWSPDGTKIAFTKEVDGRGEIFVMNSDGTDPVNLTNVWYMDEEPAWSPDGTQIAYMSFRSSGKEIYIMNADGSGTRNLTGSVDIALKDQPTWSLDGTKIAFRVLLENNNSEIFIINLDGSGLLNLTDHPSYDQYPAWSPVPVP